MQGQRQEIKLGLIDREKHRSGHREVRSEDWDEKLAKKSTKQRPIEKGSNEG